MVTSVQRFGGAVNLHVHFHTLVLDGVFVREADGTLRFHPAAPPTDEDVRRVVARVRRRERLGLAGGTVTDEDADPLAEESVALAGLSQAAVQGRAALGGRAGRGPLRVGANPDAPWVERHGPLHAHVLATIADPGVIRRILTHLGLSMGRAGSRCRLVRRRRPRTPRRSHASSFCASAP
jgi:hypothetical protein